MQFKSLLVTTIFCFVLVSTALAQFELKVNPVGALFSHPDISMEYRVAKSFGIEGMLFMNSRLYRILEGDYRNKRGFGMRMSGKYYFDSDSNIERWYTGIYSKYFKGEGSGYSDISFSEKVKSTRFSIGFLFGYKWVSKHNILFEMNAGIGRAFLANLDYSDGTSRNLSDDSSLRADFVGTISIGYRFGKKKD